MPVCYANPTPLFGPAMRLIAGITNSNPAVVTTTFANGYITGTIVRFDIPVPCGMQQINSQTAPITVLSPTTFSVPIDTTTYDIFAIPGMPSPHDNICAQVVPIGEVNSILTAAVMNLAP